MQAELHGFAKFNADEKSFTFPNGSRLKLGYCDSESDVFQFQGQEYSIIGLEEACHFSESQMQFLTTCNRSTRTDIKPRMYYTANPGGVGHQWFKRLFIDREYREGENPDDYVFIPARVYDNAVLMDANPEYVKTLEALPEDLRRAHLEGDFSVFAGQFFREFRKEIHVRERFDIPDYWKKFRSLDYGLDMTACYWWAIANNGQCFIYRELHEPNLNLSQAAKKISEMTPQNEIISYTVASPDLWNRRQETGASGMEIMSKNGLRGLVKAKHNRIQGWRMLREYLNPYVGEDGRKTARLQIFEDCKSAIKYFPMVIHDEHNPEDAADRPHIASHCVESLRYGCLSRHPESSYQEELIFPAGTSREDKERIRTNMDFAKVYAKMQNQQQIRGGW